MNAEQTDTQESPIQRQLKLLDENLGELHQRISHLNGRLSPLRADRAEKEPSILEPNTEPDKPCAEMELKLRILAQGVSEADERIGRILAELRI